MVVNALFNIHNTRGSFKSTVDVILSVEKSYFSLVFLRMVSLFHRKKTNILSILMLYCISYIKLSDLSVGLNNANLSPARLPLELVVWSR